jgi:cytochrome P450
MVFRFEDVVEVARNAEVFSSDENNARESPRNHLLAEGYGDGFYEWPRMQRSDVPLHARMRGMLARDFAPRPLEARRALIEGVVDELLAAVDPARVEVITELARPLAYRVISDMLGMPPGGDEQLLMEASYAFTRANMEPFPTLDDVRVAQDSLQLMSNDLGQLVEWKRTHRGDDLMSLLIKAEEDGGLTAAELRSQVNLLFAASHITTVSQIALAFLALMRSRPAWERLGREPDVVNNGVEELVRYDSTIQVIWRAAARDCELAGVKIPAGYHVLAWNGSANRDETHWGPTADDIDPGRARLRDSVSFGRGIHLCLGAWLARLEMQALIGAVASRYPGTTLMEEPRWRTNIALRGVESLTLNLEAKG